MKYRGAYPWGVVAAVLVLVAGSLGAQMAYSPNSQQMIAGDRNLAFNRTGISADQRNVYERNLRVWNDNRRETDILVVPESAWPRYDVVLRQTVALRGDFTEWRGAFGHHGLVLSRRGPEFAGYVVRNAERLDAAATQFVSFSDTMMMAGQVRYGQRFVYDQGRYRVEVQLGPIEASGLNLMSMMFHVLVLEDKNQTPAEDEFDATSLVWEGGVEAIDTPVGVFHLGVDPERTTVRLDRYEHPGSTREPETIESLSVGSLLDAIQSGRQIEYSDKGFTLILTFTEANLDLNDGRIRSLHARVLRSRR